VPVRVVQAGNHRAAAGVLETIALLVVISIVGDGGFQFTMHELATAKQFEIGLPIVIFNDSTYTAVKMDQAMRYDRRYIGVDLENPDFLKLAAAYGIPGVRANSPAELEAAIVEASARTVPRWTRAMPSGAPARRAFRRRIAFVCSCETRDSVTPSTSPISRSVSSS
jgi:hypothetical protein